MKKTRTAAKSRTGSASAAAGPSELELVRDLARVATEFDLAEIEYEPSGRVRISRRVAAPAGGSHTFAPGPAPVSLVSSSGAPLTAAAVAEAPSDTVPIASPFVGTFYRSPSPDASPFIEVGQTIRKGQVVCIIEAMKLMNEIESEVDGKVVEVLAKNGEHVEYGQALFRVQKA
jgi:acetyl-CoA carboxylase biotin carboxyl carrier protein